MEKAIEARLGGRRIGLTGKATADVEAKAFACETKERAKLPAWLLDAIAQAHANASDGMTPIVILHGLGCLHDNDIVCLTLKDFEELYGAIA